MTLVLHRWLAGVAGSALIFLAADAWAIANDAWLVTTARGPVLTLVGQQWQEVSPSDQVGDGQALRTLRHSELRLERGGSTVDFGANTAAVMGPGGQDGTVDLYSGLLSFTPGGKSHGQVIVRAGSFTVMANQAAFRVEANGDDVSVSVISGSAVVIPRTGGPKTAVAAGQSAVASGAGIVLAEADSAVSPNSNAANAKAGNPRSTSGNGAGQSHSDPSNDAGGKGLGGSGSSAGNGNNGGNGNGAGGNGNNGGAGNNNGGGGGKLNK